MSALSSMQPLALSTMALEPSESKSSTPRLRTIDLVRGQHVRVYLKDETIISAIFVARLLATEPLYAFRRIFVDSEAQEIRYRKIEIKGSNIKAITPSNLVVKEAFLSCAIL